MADRPTVSVVVAFLNAERFLPEAVESVFAQTLTDWELLLIDDGSTDHSSVIAREYADRHAAKVRYMEHPRRRNLGASASRNLGMARARGEFIALLDADDVWLPHKLKQQVDILRARPDAAMVYGATQYWHSWTPDPVGTLLDYVPDLGVAHDVVFRPPTLLKLADPLGTAITPCPSDLLFRREMVDRVGGFEESFRGVSQLYDDRTFLTRVYLKESVFVSGETWDRYRQHSDSCVSVTKRTGQHDAVRLCFLQWFQEYLSQQEVVDPEIHRSLRRVLKPYRHPTLRRLRGRARHYLQQAAWIMARASSFSRT